MPTTRSAGKRGTAGKADGESKASKKQKVEEPVEVEEPKPEKKTKAKGKKGKAEESKKEEKVEETVEAEEEVTTEDKAEGKEEKEKAKPDGGKGKGRGKKGAAKKDEDGEEGEEGKDATAIYEFTVNNIKGEPVSLEKYKGHVCIIVNVASKCGHTKSNYEQFVKLHEDYAESKGLRILAFPCNQFGSQEPGDAEKICKFVEERNVKFDMFEKINVNGVKAHPLWNFLKSKIEGPNGKNIKWNFTKFIIDKEGKPVERFTPNTKPLTLVDTLEKYW